MNWDKFKYWLKKEVSEHQSQVDVQDLWKSLEPELDIINQDKTRKKTFFYWLLLPLFLLLGGIWFFLPISSIDNQQATDNQKNTPTEQTQPESREDIQSIENETKKEPLNITPQTDSQENVTNNAPIITQKTNPDANTQPSLNSNNSQVNGDLSNRGAQDLTTNHQQQDIVIPPTEKKPIVSKQNNQDISNKQSIESLPKENRALKNQGNTLVNTETSNDKQNTLSPLLSQDFRFNLIKAPRFSSSQHTTYYQTDVNSFPEITRKDLNKDNQGNLRPKFRFNAGLIAGFSYADRQLSLNDEAASDLLRLRELTEKSLETSHIGFEFGAIHKSGWSFWTGLQQTRIVERFDLDTTTTEISNILGVRAIRINNNQDSTQILGQVQQTRTTTIEKRIFNNYEMLDIPIYIGYQRSFGKLNVGLQGGILVNLSLKTRGEVLDQELQILDIQDNQDRLFRSKVGLGYQFGLRISRPLFGKIDWMISPFMRIYPRNFALDNNVISQKYRLFGGKFGFTYHF